MVCLALRRRAIGRKHLLHQLLPGGAALKTNLHAVPPSPPDHLGHAGTHRFQPLLFVESDRVRSRTEQTNGQTSTPLSSVGRVVAPRATAIPPCASMSACNSTIRPTASPAAGAPASHSSQACERRR